MVALSVATQTRSAFADQMAKTPCLRLIQTHPYHLQSVKEVQFYVQTVFELPDNELPAIAKPEGIENVISGFLEKEFRTCFTEAGISIPPIHRIEREDKSVSNPETLTLRVLLEVNREKQVVFLAYLYRPSKVDPFWGGPLYAGVIDRRADLKKAIESHLWHRFVRRWAMDRFDDSFQ